MQAALFQTTTARTPFRSSATPPRPHLASRPSGPTRSPILEYPESPTRPSRRLSSPGLSTPRVEPLSYSPVRGKWRKRRYSRTGRRFVVLLLLCGFIVLFANLRGGIEREKTSAKHSQGRLKARWADQEDGLCRFVSPVEAYHRDLDRLRRVYPHHVKGQSPTEILVDNDINVFNSTIDDHFFAPTGHLQISNDSSSPHPIPLLLALGEKKWEQLLARQSRTLEQAVEEYKRRYHRQPPLGFDIWWDFAMAHKLVLPDEYDRINLDLAPFFALPKAEMKRRMLMVEEMPETFTLVVQDGRVDVQILDSGGLKWDGTLPRARDTASLLDVFARFLPDLKATFSIFDQPQIYLSWARRASLVKLGLENEHTTHLQETDSAHVRLSRSCPPDSNLRSNATKLSGKSFIYDSLESGDLCQNPYVVPLHGLTLEPHGHDSHPKPHTQLLPLFSLAKTSINSDILITPLDQFHDDPGRDPKWEDKSSSKLAWRGSPTGISMMTRDLDWRNAHRIRLHKFANNPSSGTTQFLVPDLGQDGDGYSFPPWTGANKVLGTAQEEAEMSDVAEFYYDMKLAGGPIQCSDGDGTCSDMWNEIGFAGYQKPEELNQSKFLLDIDGNGWSGRFRKLMSTNSLVIKTSLFTEWFQPHLIPWFMYVPAKLDFSDLTDILAFFRGTPKHPDLAFDETAKALAQNGQCFAKRMFRMEDLQAYMMRLFLEYARLAADEGVDVDFHLPEEIREERLDSNSTADAGMELVEETIERVSDELAPDGPLDDVWATVVEAGREPSGGETVWESQVEEYQQEPMFGGEPEDVFDGPESLYAQQPNEQESGERAYGNDILQVPERQYVEDSFDGEGKEVSF